ncbi:hypothetical protein [Vibrio coralliilyticus]|uniref:Uncharacterized protein n=1 Tax=Vibrio coralliilyticus TaxID=190893 RepID=A0AAP6ZU74_9VIBR|nr:hypothetical protein [Vibrio coralliilyticus]NOJ24284.1 hypothetical protein [Vibrio coralliilyticus]
MWTVKSLTYKQAEATQLLSAGAILNEPENIPTVILKNADHAFCSCSYDWYFSRWGPIAIEHYSIFMSLMNPYPAEEWSQSKEFEALSDAVRSHVSLQSSSPLVYEAFHCMRPATTTRPPWLDKAIPVVIQLGFDRQDYEFRALVTEEFIPLLKRARSGSVDLSNSAIIQEYSARIAELALSSDEISQLSVGDVLLFHDVQLKGDIGGTVRFGSLTLSPCRVSACNEQYRITVLNLKEE